MKAILIAASAATLALAACAQGDGEKAGENTDSAYEEATGGGKDLSDGPLENAGEAVDRAGDNAADAARRAGDDIEQGARRVGDEASEAASDAKREVNQATDGKKDN